MHREPDIRPPSTHAPDRTTAPRRYLAALVDAGGTVPPELAAVRVLVDRGHDVTVLADDTMRAEVQATGASFRRWAVAPNKPSRRPEDDPYRDWEVRNAKELFQRLLDTQLVGPAAGYATDTTTAIEQLRPEIVLASMFTIGAMVAAEVAGIPFRVLHPNIWPLPTVGIPPFGMGLAPATNVVGRLRDRALQTFLQRTWDKGGLPRLNALRTERGLAPLAHFFDQIRAAERHVVMTSAAFDLPAELPHNAVHVGPVLDDPLWAAAEAWTPPPGHDPLVLVAMSSTFQDQVSCLRRIIEALETLPVRAVVTTGPALSPDALEASANVAIVTAAPHAEVLRHAAAVVTHGGHGTLAKSLAADVPVLVLPHGRDQADNAVRVTVRGAGLRLAPDASPAELARAIRRLLTDDGLRAGAARLGAAIRADVASGALVRELERAPASEGVGASVG